MLQYNITFGSPQYVIYHPQSTFSPQDERRVSYSYKIRGKILDKGMLYLNRKQEDRRFCMER
jgi:hypothetical protein